MYLGRWCFRDLSELTGNEVFLPYHWNTRTHLENEYWLIREAQQDLISALSNGLNEIHGVSFSERYWRVVLGAWVMSFVSIIYDRWRTVSTLSEDLLNDSVIWVTNTRDSPKISNDFNEFSMQALDPDWNEKLYLQLMDISEIVVVVEEGISSNLSSQTNGRSFATQRNQKEKLAKRILKTWLSKSARTNKYAFRETYIDSFVSKQLQLSFLQAPFELPIVEIPVFETNVKLRAEFAELFEIWPIHSEASVSNEFLKVLQELVPSYLPKSYLEGYLKINQIGEKSIYPRNPKTILTATGLYHDEAFKYWVASKMECGTRLVVCQHGGFYGSALFSQTEDFELSVSDAYLTWGWDKPGFDNIVKIGYIKSRQKSIRPNFTGQALLCLTESPPHPPRFDSAPLSSDQWFKYHQTQMSIIEMLPKEFREKVRVRAYPNERFHDIRKLWKVELPEVNIDEEGTSFIESLQNARILISADNNTTWLEALRANFPTLICLDETLWPIRPEAQDLFKVLQAEGILHSSPTSVFKHLLVIWDDVESWWNSGGVQLAREKFIQVFSATNRHMYRDLRKVIKGD